MTNDLSGTLAIFAKEARAGRAKTRLIPALGAEADAQLSAAFLHDLLRRLSLGLSAQTRILLCYDPPEARDAFAALTQTLALNREIALRGQASGGLGERLAAVVTGVDGPLVFIGTDAPDLPLALIDEGLRAANGGRAFMVRTTDGGYALLVLPSRTSPRVFDGIEWSSADTARQQRDRIRAAGIGIVESDRIWWDVDEPADLLPLRRRLDADAQLAPETLGVLRSFGALPGEQPPR